MQKPKSKKPYKSLFSNAMWSFRHMLRFAPASFFLLAMLIPVNIGMAWGELYLPSLVVAQVTDGVPAREAVLTVGGLLFLLAVGTAVRNILRIQSDAKMGIYRTYVTDMLNRKSLSLFYETWEQKKTRDLHSRAEQATQMWNGVQPTTDIPRKTLQLIEAVLSYILFGTVISFASPWLLPLITVAPVVNWLCVRAYQKWEYAHRENWTDIDRKLWYVSAKPGDYHVAKDIRIYSMADWFTSVYRSLVSDREVWDTRLRWRSFLSRIADLLVILIRDGGAYALLISMTVRGEIPVDRFVLYFGAISSFASFVGTIMSTWTSLHGVSLNLCDLREYLDLPDDKNDGTTSLPDKLPEIRFEHVSYRYDGTDTDTLHDISFTIAPGEKIALVGLNGAGKTTLVKLLCGLYTPAKGQILVDGHPVSDYKREDYYTLFAPVFQDVRTGFFSLAETVSALPEAQTDMARVEECLMLAGLGDKIATLPEGIHTPLDKQFHKNGMELSGGETQKLMLARALYKDAPVLVLDEPTAALDPIAESRMYEEYHRMSAGKSALFISHRLASTRFCDRILVLDGGQIIETGTHETLLAASGKYSELYALQSCWYRDEGNESDTGDISEEMGEETI